MQLQEVRGVATTVVRGEDKTHVTYHQTRVVSFDHDKIVLDTGGWKTATTKARMNQASNEYNLGYRVYQKDFEWFVAYKGQTIPFGGSRVVLLR